MMNSVCACGLTFSGKAPCHLKCACGELFRTPILEGRCHYFCGDCKAVVERNTNCACGADRKNPHTMILSAIEDFKNMGMSDKVIVETVFPQ